jgi:hypothetical protein
LSRVRERAGADACSMADVGSLWRWFRTKVSCCGVARLPGACPPERMVRSGHDRHGQHVIFGPSLRAPALCARCAAGPTWLDSAPAPVPRARLVMRSTLPLTDPGEPLVTATSPRVTEQEVFHDPEHPSAITIRVRRHDSQSQT